MSIGMIANLMTFVNDAAHEVGIGLPILADDKECRGHILALQNVQYVRSPFGIRTVVERQRDKSGVVAAALNNVGGRCCDKVFAFMKPLAASTSRLRHPFCGRDATFNISPVPSK